jgi:hypothetical protein
MYSHLNVWVQYVVTEARLSSLIAQHCYSQHPPELDAMAVLETEVPTTPV